LQAAVRCGNLREWHGGDVGVKATIIEQVDEVR
jgi:hypothetical protein